LIDRVTDEKQAHVGQQQLTIQVVNVMYSNCFSLLQF